jgi:hypothetical protein
MGSAAVAGANRLSIRQIGRQDVKPDEAQAAIVPVSGSNDAVTLSGVRQGAAGDHGTCAVVEGGNRHVHFVETG